MRTEINCLPVENAEYEQITDHQASLLALRPKQKIKVLEDLPSGSLLNPGTMGVAGDFRNFIVRLTLEFGSPVLIVHRARLELQNGKHKCKRLRGCLKTS